MRWTGSDFRRRLDRCGRARLLFIAREPSRLHLTLNDTLHRTLELPASEALRQIVVHGPVASLALRVEEGAAGFTGYGAQFEDAAGVTVDNYSIRSNSGQALFGTSSSVNAQIGAFAPYDLVMLQYGLNIMQEGVTNYSAYAARLEKMIAFVRSCFPDAAVLVLSTSDRSVRSEKGFAPMSSAPSMVGWATPRGPGPPAPPSGRSTTPCGRRAAWSASWPTAGRARTTPTSTTPEAGRWPTRWSTR